MSLCASESKVSQSSVDLSKGSGAEGEGEEYWPQMSCSASATTEGHLDVKVYSKCCYVTRWDLNRLDM